MRSYHNRALESSTQSYKLHPKTRFTVQGDELRRTINDNQRLLLHTPVLSLAVPVDVLFEAERRGVNWVVLIDEHGRKYRAPITAFWRKPSFEVDRQFGTQRALPLDAMKDTPEQPEQFSLFDILREVYA